MRSLHEDRGGIIFGSLLKIVIGLAIAALIVFEIGAVVVAHVQADGVAVTAVEDAAAQYGKDQNIDTACDVARQDAKTSSAKVTTCDISQDGQTISVTIVKVARTFFIQHIGALRHWRIATSTQQAGVH